MRTHTQELHAVAHVGDKIRLRHDALVEVASARPGAPPTWRYLAAGSRGKLIGFRDRPNGNDEPRAVIDIADAEQLSAPLRTAARGKVGPVERRLVVFVRETAVVPASD